LSKFFPYSPTDAAQAHQAAAATNFGLKWMLRQSGKTTEMSDNIPELIRFLSEDLRFRIRKRDKAFDYEFYLLDLSEWKLRLSDRSPFIRVEARHLEQFDADTIVSGIEAVILNQRFQDRIPIVIVEGPSTKLRDLVRLRLPFSVVLDEDDVRQITTGTITARRMLDLISEQLPVSALSPYEVSSPVVGNRFFGREYEIRTILNHPETNYVIVGVRRIGKTSLLLETRHRMNDMGDHRVFFFDCSDFNGPEDYIRAVTTEVAIKERERMNLQQFPYFLRRRSAKGSKPLTFFLDEVDHLIEFDRRENWTLLRVLRSSAIQGHCRYILSGFREVIEECLRVETPLFNFVTTLSLGNLSREETRRLVTVPMQNMGISIEHEGDVGNQIFEETAGHPNFVQYYCYFLVQLMDREGRRQIKPNDLALLYGDPEFERYVFRTFSSNTTELEKAIVYSLVDRGQFTIKDIDVALKRRRVRRVTGQQLEQACDSLRIAGILDKQGKFFGFATPILPRMLRERYDVDYLFTRAKEDGNL